MHRHARDARPDKPLRVLDRIWAPHLEPGEFRDRRIGMNVRPILDHVRSQQKSVGFDHAKGLGVLSVPPSS